LVFIFGPAGIGKTALCHYIIGVVIEALKDMLMKDREWIPISYNGLDDKWERYSWREFYRTGMEGIQEPLIDYKILPRSPSESAYVPTGKPSIDRMGHAYVDAFILRRVIAALVDNANILGLVRAASKETITYPLIGLRKVLPHYLFGTYDLLPLINQNGQVARRARILHYSRYHLGIGEELKEFVTALNSFANRLPFYEPPDLKKHYEYIFGGCIGCVGLLRDWLSYALEVALDENAKTISLEHLKRTRLDENSLKQLEQEATNGERMLLEWEKDYNKTKEKMREVEENWVKRFEFAQNELPPDRRDKHVSKKKTATKTLKPKASRLLPGQQKPRKIRIGTEFPTNAE